MTPERPARLPFSLLRLVLLYAAFAGLWIILSDTVLAWLLGTPAQLTLANVLKGLAFVAVTSLLLYALLRRDIGRVLTDNLREHQIQQSLETQARRAEALLELPRAAERLDETAFMQYGQELAELLTGSEIAFIHFVNEDQESIELVTWSRRTLESYCRATHDRHYPISQAGIWADALRQRAPVVCNDYAAAANRHGLPEGHAALKRLISLPVMEGGLVRMMAGVGNKATAYTDLDVESVQLIANEIWRIVRQRRAEAALVESKTRYESLVQRVPVGVFLYRISADASMAFEYVSPRFCEILGLEAAAVLRDANVAFAAAHPEDVEGLMLAIEQARTALASFRWEGRFTLAGETRWIHVESEPTRLPNGDSLWNGITIDITEHKQAEQARLAVEARSRSILRVAPVGIGMVINRILLEVNEAMLAMTGYTRAELINQSARLLYPSEDEFDRVGREKYAQIRERGIGTVETRWRRKDGAIIDIILSSAPIDPADPTQGITFTALDITERREAEAQLRKLSLAVEQSPTSIVITDLDAHIEYSNPSFTRVSGYTAQEALGQNPRILHSGKTTRETYAELWATLTRGEVWRGEFVNRRKDGSDYVELAIISPVRQADGRVTNYLAVKQDITDRKRIEAELVRHRDHLEELVALRTTELQAAEAQLRLILDSSADGIYGMDTEGRTIFINPAACELIGHSAEEVLGRSLHDLVHYAHPDGSPYPESDCPMLSALQGGHFVRANHEVFWHKDGHSFPVSYSARPMYQGDRIIGAVVSFADITAQHEMNMAREAAHREAQRLARVRSEFLANMSHEIRTPLNAVLGFAQIGQRNSRGRKSLETFARILDSGQLLLGIVNDILDFSKIEAGKLTLEQGVIHLVDLIDGVTDLVRTKTHEKGLQFRVEEAADLPASCRGDGLRISQVLANLLSNAVKFTDQGRITLSAGREDDTLVFRIADTGIGMSGEEQARLFRPFEQADGSITRKFGGTGLGLSICKRLMDMMGGDIRVRSQPGQGSTFELRLPLVDPAGLAREQPRKPTTRRRPPEEPRLRDLAILAVEDNEVNRLVLEDMLVPEGCRLTLAENGQRAVDQVKNQGAAAFDLVLMDIQMPVMDGYEATRQLHGLAPELPVIGLTAHAMPDERERCLAVGMVDHVAKPIELDTLIAAILNRARKNGDRVLPPVPADRANPPPGPDASPLPATAETGGGTFVDWTALAAQYRDRPDFLARLLAAVIAGNADKPEQLRAAAENNDFRQLAFITHSLKGMAGNILPAHLRDFAGLVETAAREANPEAARHAQQLAVSLDVLLDEISRHAGPAATTAAGPAALSGPDRALLSDVLSRIEALLAINDTAVAEVHDRHRALLEKAYGEQAEQICRRIRAFDYEGALVIVQAIRMAEATAREG